MRFRSLCLACVAASSLTGLASKAASQDSRSREAFVIGYVKASTAFKEKRMSDAVAAVNATESLAVTAQERC